MDVFEREIAAYHSALDGWGPLPANVRMARWLPMVDVLPSCAAVIHHGGSGTMFGARVAGVPQVVLPLGADQPTNADAVVRRGVGLALDTARRHGDGRGGRPAGPRGPLGRADGAGRGQGERRTARTLRRDSADRPGEVGYRPAPRRGARTPTGIAGDVTHCRLPRAPTAAAGCVNSTAVLGHLGEPIVCRRRFRP